MRFLNIVSVFALATIGIAAPIDDPIDSADIQLPVDSINNATNIEDPTELDDSTDIEARDDGSIDSADIQLPVDSINNATNIEDPTEMDDIDGETGIEARDGGESFCVAGKPDIVPQGSAFLWNIAVKGQDLGSNSKECAPWLKKRVKQQSACKAITNWKCKWDADTQTNFATFFSDIFCGTGPMHTAVEAATSPRVKTTCYNNANKAPDAGSIGATVLANAFQALGGAVKKG
ncbi:hypothetical protein MW887_001097 [Aspergillus wentii]|nr:hypothetical protein MW887_001097 [Aspergillus wentii]